MGYRERHRVDWDEEIRKTERIRRRGLFVSALSFGVALIFIIGANRMSVFGVDLLRKFIFALCFVIFMFLFRIILRRRARMKQERQEQEQEKILEQMRLARKNWEAENDE